MSGSVTNKSHWYWIQAFPSGSAEEDTSETKSKLNMELSSDSENRRSRAISARKDVILVVVAAALVSLVLDMKTVIFQTRQYPNTGLTVSLKAEEATIIGG